MHSLLENDCTAICKSLSEHCHPSHGSKPKVYPTMANIKEEGSNWQESSMIDSLANPR